MKKELFILCIIASLIGSSSFVLSTPTTEENNRVTRTFSFTASDVLTTEEEGYISIHLPEATGSVLNPTHPKLPALTETMTLPFGSSIESITYESTHPEQTLSLNLPICPVAYPTPLDSSLETLPTRMNERIYESVTPYPQNPVEYRMGAGIIDDSLTNILTLTWYPLQYFPRSNILHFNEDIIITITYTSEPIINQENMGNDLIIIGPQEFESAAQRLVIHKNNNGLETVFTSVEEIVDTYPGRDAAENIKYYLYDSAKNLGAKYVLLLGNIDKTPIRHAAIRFYHDNDILTDLYYADVFNYDGSFSSWDTNNNDKFSEYNWEDGLIESVDLYPDIHVGRLPCKNVKEVETMIDKIITYETTTAGSSWYQKIILMAGDTFPSHGVIEGEVVTQNIANIMLDQGFETVKLWTSQGTFNPLTITKAINNGAGFISYSGHGYEQGFGTSPPDVEQRIEYFSPYMIGLFNGDKLPVIFFDACSTTKLDFTIEELHDWYPVPLIKLFAFFYGIEYDMDNYYPTISWEIVKKANGGCIASMGSTRVAFTGVDEDGAHWGASVLNTHFYEAYEPGSRLGELFSQSQTDYLNKVGTECITLEEFILVGDPSLKLGGY